MKAFLKTVFWSPRLSRSHYQLDVQLNKGTLLTFYRVFACHNSGIHDLTSQPGPNRTHASGFSPASFEVHMSDYVANLAWIFRELRRGGAAVLWRSTTPAPACACCCGPDRDAITPDVSFRNEDVLAYNRLAT